MLSAALTPNQPRIFRSRISLSRVGLRWTWVSMIAGITVLPARLTRVAPAGTATPCPAWTILLPSMISVPFSTTLPLPRMSLAPSNAVTSARTGPINKPIATAAVAATAFTRRMETSLVNLGDGNLYRVQRERGDMNGAPVLQCIRWLGGGPMADTKTHFDDAAAYDRFM